MDNVGGCELVCVTKLGRSVEVLKCLKRERVNEIVIYGGGRLVEVMLQVINLVMMSESSLAEWKRNLLVPLN